MDLNKLITDILSNDIEVVVKYIDGKIEYFIDGFVNYSRVAITENISNGVSSYHIYDITTGQFLGTVDSYNQLLELYYKLWRHNYRNILPSEQWYKQLISNKYILTTVPYEFI